MSEQQLSLQFDQKTASRFMEYHAANPEVFEMFCRFTWELVTAGRKKIGAKMVAERLRWESTVRSKGTFKINNNYVAFYARLFEKRFPRYEGIFTKRESKADAEVVAA